MEGVAFYLSEVFVRPVLPLEEQRFGQLTAGIAIVNSGGRLRLRPLLPRIQNCVYRLGFSSFPGDGPLSFPVLSKGGEGPALAGADPRGAGRVR